MVKNNFMGLEDPGVAIVTGASSGLGDIFARRLSDQGFDLILTARRKNRLENLAKELKEKNSTNVEVMVTDLARMDDIRRLETRIKAIDNLDFLCNNAGVGTTDNYLSSQANPDTFLKMIILHCIAPMLHMHAALPNMIKRDRGAIYNISSIASLILRGINLSISAVVLFLHLHFLEFAAILDLQFSSKIQILFVIRDIKQFLKSIQLPLNIYNIQKQVRSN